MTSAVLVRPALPQDTAAVLTIGADAWTDTYTPLFGEVYVRRGLAAWWDPQDIALAIDSGNVLVGESDDQPVGMSMFSIENGLIDIWKLYVSRGSRSRGVGAALLRRMTTHPGVQRSQTAYKDGNDPARMFYERYGFRETHRQPDEFGAVNVWMSRGMAPG